LVLLFTVVAVMVPGAAVVAASPHVYDSSSVARIQTHATVVAVPSWQVTASQARAASPRRSTHLTTSGNNSSQEVSRDGAEHLSPVGA
jgi:hypothetical protein